MHKIHTCTKHSQTQNTHTQIVHLHKTHIQKLFTYSKHIHKSCSTLTFKYPLAEHDCQGVLLYTFLVLFALFLYIGSDFKEATNVLFTI